ncbi:PhzF family phenazine biosynthesis protein [Halorhabdus sp. CUG00001]|uniref:PhzF family phenazine biosynthesis protein n=1 Tax=Halorhabdus sp. CUG00001 TaxID=2600297 RepID=UPI00131CA619|nr:PhzF family phenazine biosynthesis protein [Halorhabdus sp. CUG00001]
MTAQDRREVHLVDAFTTEPFSGNPAGVVPDADGLEADQMQAIAAEMGASETVFVQETGDADRRLRYFTPEQEVDLCGHATIAAYARLFDRAAVEAGTETVATGAGKVSVDVESDGTVWLDGAEPSVEAVDIDYDELAAALGLTETAFAGVGEDLPVARASTGMPFLIVPVNYFEQLGDVSPDLAAIEALAEAHDAAGIYAFTFDTLDRESTVHGRLFAPTLGVSEDPVTGTASGAVGAYLRRFSGVEGTEFRCEQGDFLDRSGRVRVRTANGVRVGGRAVTTLSGQIALPETADSEIIEA